MKQTALSTLVITLLLLFSHHSCLAQSNEELADIYFGKSTRALDQNQPTQAKDYFEKALDLLGGTISKAENANLGAMIHFTLKEYEASKKYVKTFFSLNPSKESIEYKTMLEIFVDCDEKIKEEKERKIREQKEKKRLDSLNSVWKNKFTNFLIKADTIYPFNQKGVALYKKNDDYGIVNYKGVIVKEAKDSKVGYNFKNYIITANKKGFPTKISIYNCAEESFVKIPDASEIGPLSSNYGKTLLIRDDKIVLYPDNFSTLFIYDIKTKKRKTVTEDRRETILEQLDDNDIIDRYKSDGRLKIDGEWYHWGGYLDGGILALFEEEGNEFKGFFFSSSQKFIPTSEISYLGMFFEEKVQGFNNEGEMVWLDRKGNIINNEPDLNDKYVGNSEIKRNNKDSFFIIDKETKKILKGDQKLPILKDFLSANKISVKK